MRPPQIGATHSPRNSILAAWESRGRQEQGAWQGGEGALLTVSIFDFEKRFFFDTLSRRIFIHLHALKSQFPNAALPSSTFFLARENNPHVTWLLLFLEHRTSRFLLLFSLLKRWALDSRDCEQQNELAHLPAHTPRHPGLSRSPGWCPFEFH